jgi:hypothetical protein
MTYHNKNLTLPLAFVFDEYYQQLSPSSKYAYAVLQEISSWKQIRQGYFPVDSRPFTINRSYLQDLLPSTNVAAILQELVTFQLASVQEKEKDEWMLQLLPVKISRPQDIFLEAIAEGASAKPTFKQQIERLALPLYLRQVLMEHQQRLIKENISVMDLEEHYEEHKETVSIGSYANALNEVLKGKSTIINISERLNQVLKNRN